MPVKPMSVPLRARRYGYDLRFTVMFLIAAGFLLPYLLFPRPSKHGHYGLMTGVWTFVRGFVVIAGVFIGATALIIYLSGIAPKITTRVVAEDQLQQPVTTGAGTAGLVTSFSAPVSVSQGMPVTLHWTTSSKGKLWMNPGIGDVTGKTSIVVNPSETTRYVLIGDVERGILERSVTVTVAGGGSDSAMDPITKSLLSLAGDWQGTRTSAEGQVWEDHWTLALRVTVWTFMETFVRTSKADQSYFVVKRVQGYIREDTLVITELEVLEKGTESDVASCFIDY